MTPDQRVREAARALVGAVEQDQDWGGNSDPDNMGCACDDDYVCSTCTARNVKVRALALRAALALPPDEAGGVDERPARMDVPDWVPDDVGAATECVRANAQEIAFRMVRAMRATRPTGGKEGS